MSRLQRRSTAGLIHFCIPLSRRGWACCPTRSARMSEAHSEDHLRRELKLTSRKCLGVRAVRHAALRVFLRRRGERSGAKDVVDLGVVGAIEQVEDVDDSVDREAAE